MSEPRRERKVVTVLFADLVGFTARAEEMDPEDVEAILRPYHDRLREELERHGLPVVELPSGAGHDAGILASAGVETGMLFVRSLNGGVSHSPDEHSSDEDVALALEALTRALAAYCGSRSR